MKRILAVIIVLVFSFSIVNADVFGIAKGLVKANTDLVKKGINGKVGDIKSYQKSKASFDKYEKARIDKWRKWGNEMLEKEERGVKFDKDTLQKIDRALNQKPRQYDDYMFDKAVKEKKKEIGDRMKQRREFGFWRYYGSKLFGDWVKYSGNKKYEDDSGSIMEWLKDKMPKKKGTKINSTSATNEPIPETFDTNVDMPVELLQDYELDFYFYEIFPEELPFSDIWNRPQKIEKMKKDYALAVPYEIFFENIVTASERQCKVMYEQIKVKSEVGESQQETLLRLFVWDYERRTENIAQGLWRDIGVSLSETNAMMNENTIVPTPTPLPVNF